MRICLVLCVRPRATTEICAAAPATPVRASCRSTSARPSTLPHNTPHHPALPRATSAAPPLSLRWIPQGFSDLARPVLAGALGWTQLTMPRVTTSIAHKADKDKHGDGARRLARRALGEKEGEEIAQFGSSELVEDSRMGMCMTMRKRVAAYPPPPPLTHPHAS